MKIALYARVSTKDKGQDYENQLRELRAFVERKASDGWVLAEQYVDKASGKTADQTERCCGGAVGHQQRLRSSDRLHRERHDCPDRMGERIAQQVIFDEY